MTGENTCASTAEMVHSNRLDVRRRAVPAKRRVSLGERGGSDAEIFLELFPLLLQMRLKAPAKLNM